MDRKLITSSWFQNLSEQLRVAFEEIEQECDTIKDLLPGKFEVKPWFRESGGGGVMSVMRGRVFEKVAVNVSTVFGEFSPEFSKQIPGCSVDRKFYATGISLIAHMQSPLVPAAHFNTRYITTTQSWFGGGGDLTPIYPDEMEAAKFHQIFKEACDRHNPSYYPKFKKECDEYFYLKHRREPRGVGGIFYDYLNSNNFEDDFAFTKDIGRAFLTIYPQIVREKMLLPWTDEQREYQLVKRGRYVEFNLLYDRGTKFGLMTDGNVEAILMSMPPLVRWP